MILSCSDKLIGSWWNKGKTCSMRKKNKRDIRFANTVWRNNLDSLIAFRVSVSIYLSVLHDSDVSFPVLYVNKRAQSPGLFPLTIRERNVSRFKSNKVIGCLVCSSFLKIVSSSGKFAALQNNLFADFFFFWSRWCKIFPRILEIFVFLSTTLYCEREIALLVVGHRKTTKESQLSNFQWYFVKKIFLIAM